MDSLEPEIDLAKQIEADIAAGIRSHNQTVSCLWLCIAGLALAIVVLWIAR